MILIAIATIIIFSPHISPCIIIGLLITNSVNLGIGECITRCPDFESSGFYLVIILNNFSISFDGFRFIPFSFWYKLFGNSRD